MRARPFSDHLEDVHNVPIPEQLAELWQSITEMLNEDAQYRCNLLEIALTVDGRATLRTQRATWESRGYAPPWQPIMGAVDEEPSDLRPFCFHFIQWRQNELERTSFDLEALDEVYSRGLIQRLGVSATTISNWAGDVEHPTDEQLIAIAAFYSASAEELAEARQAIATFPPCPNKPDLPSEPPGRSGIY